MGISIENYTVRKLLGEEDGLLAIKNAGFDAVDYSFYWSEEFGLLDDDYLDKAAKVREYIEKINLKCNQSHAPFGFRHQMEMNDSCKEYLEIKRAIQAAGVIGAKCIVVHPVNNGRCDLSPFVEQNERFFKSLEETAQNSGVKIAVENMFLKDSRSGCHRSIFGNPEQLSDFITKRLGTENFCACVDLGHASLVGYEPFEFVDYMTEGVIGALHIQDTNYTSDLHVPPFHGSFNWDKVCESLKNKGFTGDVNFEVTHYLSKFPSELICDVLVFMAKIARHIEAKMN